MMAPMTLPMTPEHLRRITTRALAHCDQHAQAFWDGTLGAPRAALPAAARSGSALRVRAS